MYCSSLLKRNKGVKMSLVSVIIPIYNAEKYLSKAIDSVLEQSYSDLELILVNDGSVDGSEKICKLYEKQDERVSYYYKENGGVCSARNYGLRVATGKYVFFMDNDDIIDEDLLKDNVKIMDEYDVDLVKFEKKHREYLNDKLELEFDSDGIGKLGILQGEVAVFNQEELKEKLYVLYKSNLMINIWNGLYRKSIFDEYKLEFNEDFKNGHEDILMNVQYYRYSQKIALNNNVYYIHNWRKDGSASAVFNEKRIDDAIYVVNYEKDLFETYENDKSIILSVYMDNLFICLAIMNMEEGKCEKSKRCELLKKYRVNMNNHMDNVMTAWLGLLKKDWIRAVLALVLEARMYSVVNFLFIIYQKKSIKK
jgi:glycosyltransferase involved in cell wall biosynthesis